MKKYILLVLIMMSFGFLFSQTDGINYQAVIIDPNVQELPGQNATGNILPNTPISLRFSILNESGGMDYQEIQQTSTDLFGMINVFVGNGAATSGVFSEIHWDGTPKDLKVEIDFKGSENFEVLSQEKLTFIPFAYHRNITATGDLSVAGFSAFDDDVNIDGNTTINENLSVLGNTSLEGNVEITGGITLAEDLVVNGTTNLNNGLSVNNETSTILSGDINVAGNSVLSQDLEVNGTTNLGADVTIQGNTQANGSLAVEGVTQINNAFSVNLQAPTLLSGSLTVEGSALLNQNTEINGATQINNSFSVNQQSPSALSGTLDVAGNTSLNQDLMVTGSTSLQDSFTVQQQSPTLLTGTLTVEGETVFNDDFIINGQTVMNNGLSVIGDVSINGQLQVNQATTLQNSLNVLGESNLQDDLNVHGATTLRDTFKVDDGSPSFLTGNLKVDGPTEIFNTALITGEATVDNNLQVTASTVINQNLTVDETTNLNNILNVNNGAETNLTGKLTVLGATYLNDELNVAGVSNLTNELNVTGDSNLNSELTVSGVSNLNNDLHVQGVTNLESEFNVNNAAATNLSGTLNVEGISTFNNDVTINGELNINDKIEATGLYISSDTGVEGNYVAVFENTSGSQDADGIAIKLETGTLSIDNHFISFYGDNDYLAGRIESYDLLGGDLWESFPVPDFATLVDVFDFSQVLEWTPPSLNFDTGTLPTANFNPGVLPTVTEGSLPCEGSNSSEIEFCFDVVGLGFELNFKYGTLPSLVFNGGSLPAADFDIGDIDLNFDGFFNPTAGIDATNQIGAMVGWGMRNGYPGYLPTSPWKIALTPIILSAQQVARNQGIVYGSKGADYAEWLEKENPEDTFTFGEIVGVKGGKISRNTIDADQVMTISYNPIVLGNMPETGKEENYEKVGFMGQVPALVAGEVAIGDFIVASGNNDGYAVAIAPEDIELQDLKNIIGRAWSESNPSNLSMINVSVGLKTNEWIMIFEKQETKMKAMEKQLNDLSELSNTVKAIQSKIEQLELN
ncbi:MAG: hypothetical protein R2776_05270 [Flavobacteriaceae bacterium]|nr:hypothetical protein [Flavobacteriaceae bacterium]